MYIISGCPRSGTSLMMDIMRVAFGEKRILGHGFPREERIPKLIKQENETEQHFQVREYLFKLNEPKREIQKEKMEETKDLNPNGFFEMRYTVQGISYSFDDRHNLNRILSEEKKSICKIVSQGLINSEPKYIDKIVYMLRHPRNVAKSQERLTRNIPVLGDISKMEIGGQKIKIHTPEMFIEVTYEACLWFLAYPEVPLLIVNYDDVIEKTEETLNNIKEFLNDPEADFESAKSCVDSSLKRSKMENIPSKFWEDAEIIYNFMKEKKFQEVVDYYENPKINTHEYNKKFLCVRRDMVTNFNQCELCKKNKTTRDNFKLYAESNNIEWKNKPCMYECGLNLNDPSPKFIQESIDNNFWDSSYDQS
jgi:hypothetical protein